MATKGVVEVRVPRDVHFLYVEVGDTCDEVCVSALGDWMGYTANVRLGVFGVCEDIPGADASAKYVGKVEGALQLFLFAFTR